MCASVIRIQEGECSADLATLSAGVSEPAYSHRFQLRYGISRGDVRADQAEDRVIIAHGGCVAGVLDGVSGLYHPAQGPIRFGARNQYSGGQLVGAIVKNCVARSDQSQSLPEILAHANTKVQQTLKELLPPDATAVDKPAVTGAVWKKHVSPDGVATLQIATWGDSFALVVLRDGTTYLTQNQAAGVDRIVLGIRDGITRRITHNYRYPVTDEVRNQVWSEYIPQYRATVETKINQPGGYGMLNGDADFPAYIQHMSILVEEIDTVLCCTDGVLVGDSGESPQSLSERLRESFSKGGIRELFESTRRAQERAAKLRSSVSPAFPEATVVAARRV